MAAASAAVGRAGAIGEGHTVTETALSVGYETTSAFIAMFRRSLGVTPGQYFGA
ncbi:MAG TPA: AraC family transcriptional regulator [Dehalococcoidia bacterium]|nr:AraC family transcriptional regulator [Dehalococcoidia bacterium]